MSPCVFQAHAVLDHDSWRPSLFLDLGFFVFLCWGSESPLWAHVQNMSLSPTCHRVTVLDLRFESELTLTPNWHDNVPTSDVVGIVGKISFQANITNHVRLADTPRKVSSGAYT